MDKKEALWIVLIAILSVIITITMLCTAIPLIGCAFIPIITLSFLAFAWFA